MRLIISLFAVALASPAMADPVDLATARSSLVGKWQGKLEYLDYGANKWFGLPVTTTIEDQGDGNSVETLKEVDFLDDAKSEWMKRNWTRLTQQD